MVSILIRRLAGAAVTLLVLAPVLAKEPAGPEFLVNTTTAGNQGTAAGGAGIVAPLAIAARDDGGFVVVWNQQALSQVGSPAVPAGVYAQRYAANGGPEGDEFRVFPGASWALDVVMAPDGAFVVVGIDPVFQHVQAQRYTTSGQAAGAVIAVSDGPFGPGPVCARANYSNPQAAMQADGAFVVVWACAATDPTFGAAGTYGRYYDGDGFAVSDIVPLGNFTTPGTGFISGLTPDVIMTPGGYWVVYESPCRAAPRDQSNNLWSSPCAQQFNPAGETQGDYVPLGPQRAFGTVGAARPQVARDSIGNFAVVWLRTLRDDQGIDEVRLATRSYGSTGSPIGGEFAFPAGESVRNVPRIAMAGADGASSYVVTYERDIAGDPESRQQIVAREFGLDGSSPGSSFIAHADTTASHVTSAAAMDGSGNYILAWSRFDDTGFSDVYARRFGPPPPAGQLRFVVIDPQDPRLLIPEGNGSFVVSVERVGSTTGAASTGFRFSNLSMGEPLIAVGTDIGPPQPSVLTWADGESGIRSWTFTVIQNSRDEFDRANGMILDNVTGATAGSPSAVELVLVDDDDPPLAQIAPATATVAEGGPAASLTLSLSAASGKDISLAYTLSGTAQLGADYTVSPLSPVSIPAGQTEATITLTPVDDAAEEAAESILVDLDFANSINVAAGTSTQASVTIPANDGALAADLFALLEGSDESMPVGTRRTLTLTVTNFGPDASPVVTSQLRLDKGRIAVFPLGPSATVTCERSNLDRTLSCDVPGGLAPNTQRSYQVEIEAPAAIDADTEILTATHLVLGSVPDPIQSNNDATKRLTVRLLRRGVLSFVGTEFAVAEPVDAQAAAVSSVLMSVDLTGSESEASVGYVVVAGGTATENVDYTVLGSGRLHFNGDGREFFSLRIAHDTLPEDFESFALNLVDPVNADIDPARGTFTLTILDNDQGPGDRQPDPFALTNASGQARQEGVAPGSPVALTPITIGGLGGDAVLTLDVDDGGNRAKAAGPGGAEYSINGGPFTSAAGVVRNGDAVRVQVYASSTPGAATTVTLTIGGISAQFTVVTESATPVDIRTRGSGSLGWLTLLLLWPALWRSYQAKSEGSA